MEFQVAFIKVDRVSIERMCAGKEFQVKGVDTEKAREEKLLVIRLHFSFNIRNTRSVPV